jgi:hypothetical protein
MQRALLTLTFVMEKHVNEGMSTLFYFRLCIRFLIGVI